MSSYAGARPAAPRRRFVDNANAEGSQMASKLCKPGVASVWRPDFQAGQTIIRIWPFLNPEDPSQWEPYRYSAAPNDFGDWIRHVRVMRSAGDPPVTFIVCESGDNSVDSSMSPGAILRRAVDQAVKTHCERPGWASLREGGHGRGAALPRISDEYLVTGLIMFRGTKRPPVPIGWKDDDPLTLIELSRTAGEALMAKLNEVNTQFQGADNDYEHMFVHGDPVSLQYGRYVSIYNPEVFNPAQQGAYQGQQGNAFSAQPNHFQAGGGSNPSDKAYAVDIRTDFEGTPANMAPFEQNIRAKVRPWSDILYFPTFDEQATLLATRFPADLILYAWNDHPTWIPDDVRRAAAGAHSVAMGGYGGPVGQPGWPPQQQYPGQPPVQQQPAPGGAFGAPAGMGLPVQQPAQQPQQQYAPQQPVQQPQGAFGQPQQQFAQPQVAFGQPPQPANAFGAPAGQQPMQQQPMQQPVQQPMQQPVGAFGAPAGMGIQPQYPNQPPLQQQPVQQPMQQQPVQPVQQMQPQYPQQVAPSPFVQPGQDTTVPPGSIPGQQVHPGTLLPMQPTAGAPLPQQPMQVQQPVQQQPMQQPVQQPPQQGLPFGQQQPVSASQAALDAVARARAMQQGQVPPQQGG